MYKKNKIDKFLNRIKGSSLAKDSFWSVFGNAVNMLILMICGIIIARVVGKDLFGQYGIVKNLMTSLASLAAFGFGYSSTTLISSNSSKYGGITVAASQIVTVISTTIFLLIIFFATPISEFLNKPDFKTFIYYIGVLMFFKALFTVGRGILAGYKQFKRIGINSIYSAFLMLIICYPFTKIWGLYGALYALLLYQLFEAILALFSAYRSETIKIKYQYKDYIEIIKNTFPVAIHEFSFTISSVAIVMAVLHYSSYGEYALYSIAMQWNAIIIVIPTLLMNLTLSYLSSEQIRVSHSIMFRRMILINVVSTFFPLCIVLLGVEYISQFYGDDFIDLIPILRISVFSTLFSNISLVFQSNLMSEGRSWYLAVYRTCRDIVGIIVLILSFIVFSSYNGAIIAVSVNLIMCILYVFLLMFDNVLNKKRSKNK